jgi:Ser/Thr protein kinase RdoA (MazF antagonist)
VVEQLGPTGPWVRLDAARGSTAVFGLTSADGRDRVVKQFRSPRAFEQERRALSQWFGDAKIGGARTPRLIADAPELAALILERLPGAAANQDSPIVHSAAGRFLAALHQLEVIDDDPVPLAEALTQRTRAWLRRAAAALEPEQARIVELHGPRPELFTDARRVACHRDFAPRNWLWDGERLAVVDFEHARPDLALVDLAKLCVGSWAQRPDLAVAFFAGYGRSPSDLEREQLRALVVLHGLASLAWGQERGDAELVMEGRSALALGARF